VLRFIALLALFSLPTTLHGQKPIVPPLREVRAVWVTTAAGLDWPRSTSRGDQISSLTDMVKDLHAAHFNTIYFQARARGDAYYRSELEPWADNLTGTLGKDPGWDPLAELLRLAHDRGMEVHVWFNVFKVRDGRQVPSSAPPHPSRSLAAWTVNFEGEGWLDPGIPAVREYLVTVAIDLVSRYDVDGINFDFIRYPGKTFPDDAAYRQFGQGMDRSAWRRQNVTGFLRTFVERARQVKPHLKIGCSPLGVPEETPLGSQTTARIAFAQDAREWLRTGLVDYASAQIYWDIGSSFRDPDFAAVARSWRVASPQRQVVAGIGAYKSEVRAQLRAQIDSARAAGVAGQAFFRLENIRPLSILGNRYASAALVPQMPWLDSLPPSPPQQFSSSELSANVFLLEWTLSPPAADGDSARFYAVYRQPEGSAQDSSTRIALLPSPSTSFVDTIRGPSALHYQYEVRALDRLWNESRPAEVRTAMMQDVLALRQKVRQRNSLSTSLAGPAGLPSLAAYALEQRDSVRLELVLRRPGQPDSTVARLVDRDQDPGTYVVGLQQVGFVPGVYVLRLTAGVSALEQLLIVRRQ
jgi:uncharacterized lipoprotein YddW (UPF0748 family)